MKIDHIPFSTGTNVQHELVPLPEQIVDLKGRESNAMYELMFIANNVLPLGLVNYHVESVANLEPKPRMTPHDGAEDVIIDNGVRPFLFFFLNRTGGTARALLLPLPQRGKTSGAAVFGPIIRSLFNSVEMIRF